MKLLLQAITKFILGILILGLLLFLSAGTLNYMNAWLFLSLLFIPILIVGIMMWFKNKELLKKRLNAKEKEKQQVVLLVISLFIFIGAFIMSGLDYRYKLSNMKLWVVIAASVIMMISYMLYVEVMRENVYLSRIIEVQENQKVIDTGLYRIVRHPMYFATTFLFLSFPLVLGSWYALIIMIVMPIILVIRIINEEKVLEKELNGYKEYKKKVKYRLIPFIW